MPTSTPCFQCGAHETREFYEVREIPVHSCLLMTSAEDARGYPRGDLVLSFCARCGFIQNAHFDPRVHEYSPAYEESQAFSAHFCAFAERLAQDLIARYDLRGRDILEIGCGKGDFLLLLAERGRNRGIGIDPGFRDDRLPASSRVRFIRDFYSEKYVDLRADLVCCRHTLEHIQPVREFVALSARAARPGGIVFYEVPDTTRVLAEGAFWDIYYEHCSYFTLGSLGRLFRSCSLPPLRLYREFGDQYLCVDASAGSSAAGPLPDEDDLAQTARLVDHFAAAVTGAIDAWRTKVLTAAGNGRRVVLWGSGSKGVAFLTTLRLGDAVRSVVDINPHRQGRFMPGSGHEIVGPEVLRREPPDLVIVMNPAYVPEIAAQLRGLGLEPEILALGAEPSPSGAGHDGGRDPREYASRP